MRLGNVWDETRLSEMGMVFLATRHVTKKHFFFFLFNLIRWFLRKGNNE